MPKPKHIADYRTHFYAPKKYFMGNLYDTFWFNIIVIWLGCLFLYITLYFESLKWLIDIGEKFNMFKKKD